MVQKLKPPIWTDLPTMDSDLLNFYNTAKCHSSRVSLLTGLYCNQAGGSSLSRATIAEVLKSTGYSTWMNWKYLNKQLTDFGFKVLGHLSCHKLFTGDNTLENRKEWSVQNIEWKTFLHNP